MRQIILADQYKTYDIIKEEKELWVYKLLLMIGIPVEQIDENNQEILKQYDLQIWDDLEHGDVEIIQNDILIGKWYNPSLFLKYDEQNKPYYEIHIDYDSIFDNEFKSALE